MKVDLSVSSSVLKQGEVLTVNCTVKDTEMVFFSWDFPRRQVPADLCAYLSVSPNHYYSEACFSVQEIEPLMDLLPNRIRSFVNITSATVADSGRRFR